MSADSPAKIKPTTLGSIVPQFLAYAAIERHFSRETITKYADCLRQVLKMIGDKDVEAYSREDLFALKTAMFHRSHSIPRQIGILAAFKGVFKFCREELKLPVLDPNEITVPKRPRREVVYLTAEEVERFVGTIRIEGCGGKPLLAEIRFRALVEILLGSAMRISEVLSLDRESIDFELKEAKIIGKGNKERVVFFTDRALLWARKYLDARTDNHPALFVSQGGRTRLNRADIWRPFARHRILAGINKPVRPHLLRHTAATQLLFNGCPIGHIKEILGHERLETTCRYYLGLDHRAAKEAHQRFLVYRESTPTAGTAAEHSAALSCPLPNNTAPSSGYPDARQVP